MKHASCLVTNFASAPLFEIAADDFALCLRARMHLPCRIAPFFEMPAHHLLLHQRGIVTQVHDAIRDLILETAVLADHVVKAEPQGQATPIPLAPSLEPRGGRRGQAAERRNYHDVRSRALPPAIVRSL